MGRTQTAGVPSPHHFHHPPPPLPATSFPLKPNNINHQQQGYNVVTAPPPQYQQNNNVHATNIMRPQPQSQPLSHAAIGVPFKVAPSSSPQPQIMPQVDGTGQANAKVGSSGNAMVMPWTTGLFDCMDDPNNALITAFFPCITFGQIADVLDNGHTTCATSAIIYAVAPCLVSRVYRRKLRQRFGLVEAPASDWIVHSLFEHCAICQEYRELTNRGINPALGYRGNINNNQSQQSFGMVPPINQTMG